MSIYALELGYPVVDPLFDSKSGLRLTYEVNVCNGNFSLTDGTIPTLYKVS